MSNKHTISEIRHQLSLLLASYQTVNEEIEGAGITDDAKSLLRNSNLNLNQLLDDLDMNISPSLKNRKVFIQFAMRIEAEPVLNRLNAKQIYPEWSKGLPFLIYEAHFETLDLVIGIAGVDPKHDVDSIGSVPAAVLAQLAIANLGPKLIINAGTCGGFQSKDHQIGDVMIGTDYVAFHHRRINIPKMDEYGVGKYPVCDSSQLRKTLELKSGIVTTGDALDCSKEDEAFIKANGGTLKEMEGAGIGWVCSLSKTPLLPLKTVTDFVDHPADTAEQFFANYKVSVEHLTKDLVRVLQYLSANPKDQVWIRSV